MIFNLALTVFFLTVLILDYLHHALRNSVWIPLRTQLLLHLRGKGVFEPLSLYIPHPIPQTK